uniref:Unk like zinc finger n=1 Tax=Paramormyrops kingsleyae TaxID=1676925 RepID=A0A3B3RXD7_9TELE|nr:putative E3 ubiquitin-protein ligase UNKL isoform X1 [Paramormyrops kingsleyae]XP_023663853.1 putative E3 ubiquitin-protein ligase UNKL isoform X1 [Paramormyrops kingsleyae]
MPSVSKTAVSASPQTEKPTHYTYLKEFRTEQCPLFLQHKCTQHRPFTCFHWHFLNQRRRRPIRRRDGTFNYSPDVYCTKYDETTGLCPDGDECPYLHRTTGDTERKYHLRYYKTGSCIHETDARGHCVKNGQHCAFAHGPHDVRPPVCDIREIQAQEALQNGQLGTGEGIPDLQPGVLASQAMIEKILTEDPRWQDSTFVLANYKTEQCTKPPRLCRQGYACPHYHNSRDRRRNPRKFKYRSTPCPNVKHGDEWGEPTKCDSGDNCQYCHSRTEQQFHPEIYKSTKCNDMRQTAYCPRGPFCAFAHVERIPSTEETLNSLLCSISAGSQLKSCSQFSEAVVSDWGGTTAAGLGGHDVVSCSDSPVASSCGSDSPPSAVGPIGRPWCPANGGSNRRPSLSTLSSPTSDYRKAPGFEREDQSVFQGKILKGSTIDCNHKLNPDKQNLVNLFNPLASGITSSITSSLASSIGSDGCSPTALSTMNAKALPFYPASNTVESVVGSALDLNFNDIDVVLLDKELEQHENGDLSLTSEQLLCGSAPVSIPGSLNRPPSLRCSSLPASPLDSLSQSLRSGMKAPQGQPQTPRAGAEHTLMGTSVSSPSKLGLNGAAGGGMWDFVSGIYPPSSSPVASSAGVDLCRLRRELEEARGKITQWEMAWQQAKQACKACQKDAQEAKERAKVAEGERQRAAQKREGAERKLRELQGSFDMVCRSPNTLLLRSYGELDQLALPKLLSIQNQLCTDLDVIDTVIYQLQSKKCMVCQKRDRSIILQPCQHYVLCESCAPSKTECPYCETKILSW